MPAASQPTWAWTPPDPLAEGEDSGYEPEWHDEPDGSLTEEEPRRWAGELTSPFAAAPEADPVVPEEAGPFSVEGELLRWATELAQAPQRVRAAFDRQEETEAVRLLVGSGVRDAEWLTDLVFHTRHRELGGQAVSGDALLEEERQAIHDEEIRPRLAGDPAELLEGEGFFGALVGDVLATNAVHAAFAGGERDENKLTDIGYRAVPGTAAKIKPGDPPELKERWTRIRDRIVRPFLRLKKTGLDRLVPRGKPFVRLCCLLFGPAVLDLAGLGTHGTAPVDALGEVYTRKLGFVDLGHARETADVTLWALNQLQHQATAGATVALFHGSARLLRDVPLERRLALAQQLAYVDAVEHEIATFGVPGPGLDNSSFSPEDLPSNLFGTLVAAAAFRADGGTDAAITQQLKQQLTAAGAQPVAVAVQVQQAAAGRGWWGPATAWWADAPLRKRNFTADPWLIDEQGAVRIAQGALPAAPPLVGADFEYESAAHLKNTEFAQKIAAIRAQVPASARTP
ncbi:hypothetical protein Amsp01_091180 [Amycolatopsis sp. NBRC 101858]|uniref:DUF4056 domain-containing protein n=1 Tax=Amycolatopsis sp. NBRC 101858 TaxID=3032200 RepID=UPI0024A10801|nr:DUF4056 domain-containing protein [Amycolatopsis sp. NBRC 101858]GLY43095.1 hypothetical protein Amsp01_091180 [Amycolatopsis sp. NBRC 101858]